ncbi:HEAT repeat domain-containing protein [Polyangium jinanense]|uniref:HEAT repeat domain-containing protein n=1 Tax=Polyangium jinanense TaxID=2829994 RepID=A0A9X3X985_9BACT|nr:HEAT repeat domain-containing protein [Polyangium jinanense]MDC3959951.1 HEAT repeat domain-containing protein [Polyangium jinanense]MDC3983831.1 HEAT repeat domain-containing protein [Polyangium jinanense]
MAWFADLSPYENPKREAEDDTSAPAPPILNIGWLEPGHSFPVGSVSTAFLVRLAVLVTRARTVLSRRNHTCAFVHKKPIIGTGEIRVVGDDRTRFAAPVMIHHYVAEHGYRPPDAFIAAVLRTSGLSWERAYEEDLCASCGLALQIKKKHKVYREDETGIESFVQGFCGGCGVSYQRRAPLPGGERVAILRALEQLRAPDPDTRIEAATDLSYLRGQDSIPQLVALLHDAHTGVRRAAIMALVKLKADEAIVPLIENLERPNEIPLDATVRLLAGLGAGAVLRALVAPLRHTDTAVRSAAVEVLERIGGEAIEALLMERLDDPDPSIRRQALRALSGRVERWERRLLSEDYDGAAPFIDPRAPLDDAWLSQAASRMQVPIEEVRGRVEALAPRFGIPLRWRDRG